MTQEEQYVEPFKRISVNEARQLIDRGDVTIVDVREGWEYAQRPHSQRPGRPAGPDHSRR